MAGTPRPCLTCSKIHKAVTDQCRACIFKDMPPQTCITCGESFPAAGSPKCWRCRQSFATKPCIDCGKTFKGSARRCEACRAVERTCACGKVFHDRSHTECSACRATTRACQGCGRTITALANTCGMCNQRERECVSCGKAIVSGKRRCNQCEWIEAPDREGRLQRSREAVARRRQNLIDLAVDGGITPEIRERILAEPECAYCDQPPTETDHVWPLIAGGLDHESNVVPACTPCNRSKGPRFLTEWARLDRVKHGIEKSPKVVAEWERLTALPIAS